MKKLLVVCLALIMVLGSMTVAFADATAVAAPGPGTSEIQVTAEAATFSVTVPTTLPVTVNAAGVVSTADNAQIINYSHGAVKVTALAVTAKNDWTIVDFDSAKMAEEMVGAKKIAFTINGDKTTGADAITFTASNFPRIDGATDASGVALDITYDAKVAPQAVALDAAAAVDVVFTLAWDAE